jgi:regulator of replication initiation timing
MSKKISEKITDMKANIMRLLTENTELKRERDEARKKLDEEMKWHHRTHQELVEAQCKLLDIEYDKLKS